MMARTRLTMQLPREVLSMPPDRSWTIIKDRLRRNLKDQPANPAEVNVYSGRMGKVACCTIKNKKLAFEALRASEVEP